MDRLIGLVLLHWKLDVRGMARARETALGLFLMIPGLLLFAAAGSAVAFWAVRTLARDHPDLLLPALSVTATAFGVFWALSPLLAGIAATESHDLGRLLLFPVPVRTLVLSSLLANLVQPLVLVEVPILVALAAALSPSLARFPAVLAGFVLSFAFILAAAQVAALVLQWLGRNRRFQDLALTFGLGVGFFLSLLPLLLVTGGLGRLAFVMRLVARTDVFAASPFAWGARAAVHAAGGDTLGFTVMAAGAVAAVIGTVALATAMARRLYRSELSLGTAGRKGTRVRMALPGPLGALIEKDLRTAWRDPALRAALFMGLLGPIVFLFFLSQTRAPMRSGYTLLLLATLVGLSTVGANAFATERRGLGLLLSFPLPRWKILVGKNVGALLFRTPAMLALLLTGVLVAPWSHLPAAVTIAGCLHLIATGMDNYMSILVPIPVPPPGRPLHTGVSGGRGLVAAALSLLILALTLVMSSPFIFLAWLPALLGATGLWLVTLPLAAGGAIGLYALLVGGAEGLLRRREPDLLARVLGEV